MNNNVAITADSLGKQYQIATEKVKYRTIRESMSNILLAPARRVWKLIRGQSASASDLDESFWALRDVSFEVKPGEVVGILGRNGSGKSTLLKILSRITYPTRGQARIHGRVGSLLEVGTGFHKELTGRENIYLNGAILGMRKKEIDSKFDEIVAFAETEKFLDTPVKHYSSGMKVRLAFAVAAHLEPEILLVDEVLAVGDLSFQKKCLGKMEDVASEGRTVLFVSHNMAAVSTLCSRGLVLEDGKLAYAGNVSEAISHYLKSLTESPDQLLERRANLGSVRKFRFTDITFLDGKGRVIQNAVSGQPLTILLSYVTHERQELLNVDIDIAFHGSFGQLLFFCKTHLGPGSFEILPGDGKIRCHIPSFPLNPGRYSFKLRGQHKGFVVDKIDGTGNLLVEPGDFYGTGNLPTKNPEGIVMVPHSWEILPGVPAEAQVGSAQTGELET